MLTLVYATAGSVATLASFFTDGIAFAWVANAIAAVWIVSSPRSHALLLMLATVAGDLLCNLATFSTLRPAVFASYTAANLVEVMVAVLVLRGLLNSERRSQSDVAIVLSLILGTAVAGPIAGALVAAPLFHAVEGWALLPAFDGWWSGSAAGAIIAAPLLAIDWSRPDSLERGRLSVLGSTGLIVAVLAFAAGAMTRFGFPFILLTVPLMIAAIRLTPRWMALLCSAMATLLIAAAAYHVVPNVTGHPAEIHVATTITVIVPLCASFLVWQMRRDRLALLLSNDQVRRTFDESAVGIAVATAEGEIVKVNPAYCAMFDRQPEQMIGLHYHALTHPDDREMDDRIVGEAIADGRSVFEFEKRYLRPDGSAFWTRLHGTILRDESTDEPRFFVTQVFDIDQRKRAEDELAVVRNRWTFALESARQGVWDADLVTKRWYYSAVWAEILGIAEEELGDSRLFWRSRIHPDDLALAERVTQEHLQGRSTAFELTVRLRHRNGNWIWVLARGRVIARDADDRPLRMIGTITDITRQKESEEKLVTLNERIRLAAQAGGVGMWSWDEARQELVWDERMFQLYGLDPAAATHTYLDWTGCLHPEDRASAEAVFTAAIRGEKPYNAVFRVVWPGGEVRHIRALAVRKIDAQGGVIMLGTNWDITEQHLVAEALAAEKERLRVTLHSIGDAVISTDTRGRITFMNLAAESLTGSIEPLVRGELLESIYRPVHEDTGEVLPSSVAEALASGVAVEQQHPGKLVRKDGSARSIRDTAAPVRDSNGDVIGAVLVFQDVTTARALQRDLAYAASHDALTGLKNRAAFEGILQSAYTEARGEGEAHAVLFIDLDRFKVLNDTAGHAAGDSLLREVAANLRGAVRSQDVVARLGGDEFGVLLRRCSIDDAEAMGERIIETVKTIRFAWNGKVYRIGASIGATALTAQSAAVADVLAQADVACYAAKAGGRDRVSVYRPDSSEAHRHLSDLHIAAGIRESIEADRFRLYAQEIRDLESPLARGRKLEILTRMVAPDGSMISPGVFIPAAERFDLMSALDHWVIRTALRSYGARIQSVPDLTVAINLSANSLSDPGLWDFVSAELAATGFDPARLVLEITESAVINNYAAAERFVEAARGAGCRVSLDDFGSGVSSFNYLKRFSVDTIKIDGTFVRNMKTSHYDRTIVRLIHGVAAELGVDTVAEYVEDVDTVDMLRDIGIRYGQGFLFHRPRPLGDVLDEHGARQAEPMRASA